MENSDQEAELQLEVAIQTIDEYYKERGIFQDQFGFGERPVVVVVDFAFGWTDASYAAGSRRLDQPVEQTSRLISIAGRCRSRSSSPPARGGQKPVTSRSSLPRIGRRHFDLGINGPSKLMSV